MSHLKNEVSFSDFEQQTYHVNANANPKSRHLNVVNWVRNVMNSLAFVCGVLVFAFALDAKLTYNNTNVPASYFVSLWPQQFNTGPTNALISTGVIVTVMSFITAVVTCVSASKGMSRTKACVNLVASISGVIGTIVSLAFYHIVKSSDTVDTIESWSCRWRHVPMSSRPHFGTLCREYKATIGLAIFLIPLEILLVTVTCYQTVVELCLHSRLHNK